MLRWHPIVLEHTAFVNQTKINSYPETMETGNEWKKGDLVVHLAGCWVKNTCTEQWKEFMDKRVTVADVKKQKGSTPKAA